jgi:hypothetical protein
MQPSLEFDALTLGAEDLAVQTRQPAASDGTATFVQMKARLDEVFICS